MDFYFLIILIFLLFYGDFWRKFTADFLTDGLTGTTLEEHIIGQHHSSATVILQHDHNVLEEIELVVLRLYMEVGTVNINTSCRACAKWWIGKDDINQLLRLLFLENFLRDLFILL